LFYRFSKTIRKIVTFNYRVQNYLTAALISTQYHCDINTSKTDIKHDR